MEKIYLKIKKVFSLIFEGRKLQDKIKIILWFFGIKQALFLKNKDGLFFIRKNSADLWMLSPLGEGEFRKYFNLSEGIFLDLGANVGKYSILLGKKMGPRGKVYAFEPEPNNLKALKTNLSLNKIKNVQIIEKACSNLKGKVDFYLDDKNTGGHSLLRKTNKKISVKSDTLDEILRENKVLRVDLIKIDLLEKMIIYLREQNYKNKRIVDIK